MGELVREWVTDWYDPKYYERSPIKNPKGPATGTHKVQRGYFGAPAELGALVFVRGNRTTHPLDHNDVPYKGYSSLADDTFRCALHKNTPV